LFLVKKVPLAQIVLRRNETRKTRQKNVRQKNKELPDPFIIFLSHIFLSCPLLSLVASICENVSDIMIAMLTAHDYASGRHLFDGL